ncbi:MAG: hypothetical protein BA863_14040 [Desulfovibrio sp. S3730MH75]|nr:MAG: hypothetical protein BA863_14040 [Desulfovibrio sp. S3730MH75]
MKNNESIGLHRLIILPILFLLAISAFFLFHTTVVEQQRLKTVKQCLEDIRSDIYRIAEKETSSQKSYETGRLTSLIEKLKEIKADSPFYEIINSKELNLIDSADSFLKASTQLGSTPTNLSLSALTQSLDKAISEALVSLNDKPRASIRSKVKIEYSLIILICIFILIQYFVVQSYIKERLDEQCQEHEESTALIKKLTERDSLTNLPGRKKFYTEADREIASATRYSSDLTLIKMDIHGFKDINQKHGQRAGDKILSRFARLVRKNLRRPDSFFRVGGDKFVILAPHTTIENAEHLTVKINKLLKMDKLASAIHLEINVGIASCEKDDTSETLMKKVAAALKSSKIRGAGAVAIYGHSEN